jgi:hypothetical protein
MQEEYYVIRLDTGVFFVNLGSFFMRPIETMYHFVRLDLEETFEDEKWR